MNCCCLLHIKIFADVEAPVPNDDVLATLLQINEIRSAGRMPPAQVQMQGVGLGRVREVDDEELYGYRA